MDWKSIITDIQCSGRTLAAIAKECGFASAGALHDLKMTEGATCSYERGHKLMELHKKVKRAVAKVSA
jgi:hypothetical protein